MANFEEALHAAMAKFLRKRDKDAQTVTSYEQNTRNIGYCDTCSYEVTEVNIWFLDSKNQNQSYSYSGDLGGLMRELTDD